jgi:hypothetical protein
MIRCYNPKVEEIAKVFKTYQQFKDLKPIAEELGLNQKINMDKLS